MDIASLEQFGFKEWPTCPPDRHDRHWQYCRKDEHGKRFFVQVRLWRFSKYSTDVRLVGDSFDAWCQYDLHGKRTFDVIVSVSDMTPAEVVAWFNDVWEKLGCTYYEKWEE